MSLITGASREWCSVSANGNVVFDAPSVAVSVTINGFSGANAVNINNNSGGNGLNIALSGSGQAFKAVGASSTLPTGLFQNTFGSTGAVGVQSAASGGVCFDAVSGTGVTGFNGVFASPSSGPVVNATTASTTNPAINAVSSTAQPAIDATNSGAGNAITAAGSGSGTIVNISGSGTGIGLIVSTVSSTSIAAEIQNSSGPALYCSSNYNGGVGSFQAGVHITNNGSVPALYCNSAAAVPAIYCLAPGGNLTSASVRQTYYAAAPNAGYYFDTFAASTGSSPLGSITTNGGATGVLYNLTSDERLKTNIKPLVGAIDKIMALQPRSFDWKSNGYSDEGFIAQELHKVIPNAVTPGSAEKDEKTDPWQVCGTAIIPHLTAAFQDFYKSAMSRIAALEDQVKQLTAR